MAASGARECLSYLTNRIERLPSAALAAQQETAPQDIQACQPVKNITGIALAEPERAFCVLEVQVAKPADGISTPVIAVFLPRGRDKGVKQATCRAGQVRDDGVE